MKKIIAFSALLALVLSACKSDFKLTAKWKEQMVIYCLLNESDSVQYIRVNKTFLGQGDAYQMAMQHDSLNYKNILTVKLEAWTPGGGTYIGAYDVDTTSTIPQDNGAFANQPQIFYRVHTGNGTTFTGIPRKLNDSYEYHLTVTNPLTGYTATAKTTLVIATGSPSGTGLTINSTFPVTSYNFYNLTTPYKLKYTTGVNARLYDVVFRFHYTEYSVSGTVNKYVDKDFGTLRTQALGGGEALEADLSWSDFTQFLATSMNVTYPVAKRIMGKCELIIYVGGDEFATYIDVNQPVSSITGEKPTYSNIYNGVGLFSCRYTYDSPTWDKPLNNPTLNNLATDPTTCFLHIGDANGNPSPSCP
jgi:hypothetical protein